MSKKIKYYSLENILEKNAVYNVIIGQRSNGKTYSVLKYALSRYVKTGEQVGIIRRWGDDFKGKNGATYFELLAHNNVISDLTGGEWTGIHYYAGRWYLSTTDDDGKVIKNDEPFAYAFALNTMERDKGASYPMITTIFFDEFLTRSFYLNDEFVIFMNVISTIIRQRDNVKIFMCGNTVSKHCPYFSEMGLTNVAKMKPGDIDLYKYGNSKLTVAVEFSDMPSKQKPSDFYFAFENPRLNMITGQGAVWEMDIYPHLPRKYAPKDVLFSYFILFDRNNLQCDIVNYGDSIITFIHRKTTEIRNPDKELVFSPDRDPRPNWRRRIDVPRDDIGRKIFEFFRTEKVFYQDNEIGEIVRGFLNWCKTGE